MSSRIFGKVATTMAELMAGKVILPEQSDSLDRCGLLGVFLIGKTLCFDLSDPSGHVTALNSL